jgi:hypothetical protein
MGTSERDIALDYPIAEEIIRAPFDLDWGPPLSNESLNSAREPNTSISFQFGSPQTALRSNSPDRVHHSTSCASQQTTLCSGPPNGVHHCSICQASRPTTICSNLPLKVHSSTCIAAQQTTPCCNPPNGCDCSTCLAPCFRCSTKSEHILTGQEIIIVGALSSCVCVAYLTCKIWQSLPPMPFFCRPSLGFRACMCIAGGIGTVTAVLVERKRGWRALGPWLDGIDG